MFLVTRTIEEKQCYERDGCCCIISLSDAGAASGRYIKDESSGEYYSAETRLYISVQGKFWMISNMEGNVMQHKFYATKGFENCPQNVATQWYKLDNTEWGKTAISFSCWNSKNDQNVQATKPAPLVRV